MMQRMFEGLPKRGLALLGLLFLSLLVAPAVVDAYTMSVILITLYFAYVGQAWNLMMGYAGQLSLGHTLYVGLGAYTSAALFVHFGLSPVIGLFVGMAIAIAAGTIIGSLAFRFGIGGVYFALLTIAFAEFTRIIFQHWEWVGAMAGLFLPVENRDGNDLLNLRGSPTMFYYIILFLCFTALAIIRLLMRSRLGYYWLAIREDQEAAQAVGINTFRYKIIAVAISAALTSVGGVFIAFYYNNLFPQDAFGMHRSIELILAPIIGGMGTLFGPILGAFILTPLGEGLTILMDQLGIQAPGVKQLFYGVILLIIIRFVPGGVWPLISKMIGIEGRMKGDKS